ncbi:MAG: sigma-70 family RNA polymerase sigma factor [Longimicrobiaceae bacterium]
MPDRLNFEALFLEHLDYIDRAAIVTCTTHSVWGAEAEDFAAWIKLKLMEDDYAVFRNFRGESGLRTYLATVVVRQFHEYWRERLGRWRPSAMAERLGQPAKDLEALVYRDGYSLQEAAEKLRTAGRTTLSDVELARLLDRLPPRTPLRLVEVASEPALAAAADPAAADQRITAAEAMERHGEVIEALDRAMGQLEPEEQFIVKMHFAHGHTLADVARALRVEQKPLYRRVERLRRQLRGYLENSGVRSGDVRDVLWEQEA